MGNPIFARADAFSSKGRAPYQAQAPQQPYGYPQQGYGQPGYGQYGQPPQQWAAPQAPVEDRMTYDDVIVKTGLTLLAVAVVAFVSYKYLAAVYQPSLMFGALIISSLVGFVTVLIVSTRRKVSPVGVFVYALIEGVFIGAFTLLFESMYPGIAVQAVGATFAAAGVTLIAYKGLKIRVTDRFRRIVFLTTASFAAIMLINLVLSLFGVNTGLRSFGLLGFVVALLAAGLAVLNLIVDFDYVEKGVRNGAPASESWRAALGFTVTMVWLYTEILRILSYFRN